MNKAFHIELNWTETVTYRELVEVEAASEQEARAKIQAQIDADIYNEVFDIGDFEEKDGSFEPCPSIVHVQEISRGA